MIVNLNKMNLDEQDAAIQLLAAARVKGWDLGMLGFVLPENINGESTGMRLQIKRSEGYMALFLNENGEVEHELVITEAKDLNEGSYS